MRNIVDFNGGWTFEGQQVTLPHTWNSEDGQNGGEYKRGTYVYEKHFSLTEEMKNNEVWIEFDAAALTAKVWLNGEEVGSHDGGFSAFRCNLTKLLKEENELKVYVDNSKNMKVYPQSADFTFYGGLYRDVKLVIVPKAHFALDYFGGQGIKVTPIVDLDNQSANIVFEAWVSGEGSQVEFRMDGKSVMADVADGYAKAKMTIENVHLWNGLEDPFMYKAAAVLDGDDAVEVMVGCRSFYVDSETGFYLNGKPYRLYGVAKHQDWKGAGNATTKEMLDRDMELIKEIGATTVRLAHYQHPQYFYDLCDQNGVIVWAEIPYISNHVSEARENTLSQMHELVVQNYHHPSIVCWGLSNEISMLSEVNEDLIENHRLLNQLCHDLDSTRLTVMAHVNNLEKDSPMHEIPDIESYNLYFGWYVGEFEDNATFFDEFHRINPNRCVGLSEYGADANPKFQSAKPERSDYTESYQALYHERVWDIISERPYIWASHVWNMFDFAAAGRHEGGNPGRNQKGLVTFDRQTKKDAFYMYKSRWSKEPMVHLCGKRYVKRCEEVTEIKVYSNLPEVTLYVDGEAFETQRGNYTFTFNVPMKGCHNILAVAGDCKDEMQIEKVDEPFEDYILKDDAGIINWFEDDAFKAGFYSIKDTIKELTDCEKTRDIAMNLLAALDDKFKETPGFAKMLGHVPLEGIVKRSGNESHEEIVKETNKKLQRIAKEN